MASSYNKPFCCVAKNELWCLVSTCTFEPILGLDFCCECARVGFFFKPSSTWNIKLSSLHPPLPGGCLKANLVGGFKPSENISQIGSLSQLLDTIGENQKCSKPPTRNTLCNRHRAPPTCPWRRHVPSSHPPAIAAAPPRDDAGNSPGQSPADTCDPNGRGALKPAEPVAVAT